MTAGIQCKGFIRVILRRAARVICPERTPVLDDLAFACAFCRSQR